MSPHVLFEAVKVRHLPLPYFVIVFVIGYTLPGQCVKKIATDILSIFEVSFLICGGSLVTKSCLTLATPWTVACQSPLSMGFPKQAYWSKLPFPSPGDLPDPGIKSPSSAIAGKFYTAAPSGSPIYALYCMQQATNESRLHGTGALLSAL